MKISAAIITYNEERNIARVLESLRCCDEIVVIDSGSNDRTIELATKLGARVIDSVWRGFAGQKNYASEHCVHDWVLSLDADEALSEALEAEIWQIKKNGPQFDAYTMPRLAQYLGRWILHSGWYPDRKIRLFDRRRAKWVGDYVHESVAVEGTIGHLKSNILHFTCSSLSEHLKTMDRYTTLAAEQLVEQKREIGWTQLALDPPWTFF
jgi:glycosyltransferase involved in cell wall biosynthesis